jgi:hypothetical protein
MMGTQHLTGDLLVQLSNADPGGCGCFPFLLLEIVKEWGGLEGHGLYSKNQHNQENLWAQWHEHWVNYVVDMG